MKLLQSPLFWLGILVVAGVVLGVVLRTNKGNAPVAEDDPDGNRGGFKDALKNPERWMENVDESTRALEVARRMAKTWDNRKVDMEVRRFLFDVASSDDAWQDKRVLESLGDRTRPTLLACMRDETLRNRLVTPTSKAPLPEAPFNRLCKMFGESPPPECVPLLAPYLDNPSDGIRKDAAFAIGCVGTKECVLPLRKAIADENEYVRSYAVMGLGGAIDADRLDGVCRRELFADLKSMISKGRNVDDASGLLLRFDEKQTESFLRSEAILSADFARLHEILRTLNGRKELIPRDRLLGLADRLKTRNSEYPGTYQFAGVLRALGRHRVPEDRDLFEQYLAHADETVASGAAEGLVASHGLDGYQDRIWERLKDRDLDALTEAQRHFHAVRSFENQVNNGGLSQYFFNSTGDDWRIAVAGLEAMGSKVRLAIIKEAISKFGKNGPSANREERMIQLSKLVKVEEALFDKLDSRYYECKENIDVLATRYVLKHPDAFR